MGKKSNDNGKKKRQQEKENRGVQEDELVFAGEMPKRRNGKQPLPHHAFRPGPSFNSGSFQTPTAHDAPDDDIRPRRMQSRRHDPHDLNSRQDERGDPRFSGGMKVNPLFSGDDDTRANDDHHFTPEYAHYSESDNRHQASDNRHQADWNRRQNQHHAQWPEYPIKPRRPIQGSSHQQYPEDGIQPRMRPWDTRNVHRNVHHLPGQRDPGYGNMEPSRQGMYESNTSRYVENARSYDGRKLPDIPMQTNSSHHAHMPYGAQTRPHNAYNHPVPNHMPESDRFPPRTVDANNLSAQVPSMQTPATPMYLPQTTGQRLQPGPSIPAYHDNMYMVPIQPQQMAMNRTENQALDAHNVGMQQPTGQTDDTLANVSITAKIILRLITASLIIVDLVMDWIQYAEWTGTSVYVGYTTHSDIDCDEYAVSGVVTMYLISCIIAVLFAIFQLVNMVGETLMEIKGEKLKGFQMLHGWIDSSLSTFLEEIPQCILIIIFQCQTNSRGLMLAICSAIIGSTKNEFRFASCKHIWKKQKSKPCCRVPEIKCGEFKCTVPLCWVVYIIHFIICSSEKGNCYHDTTTVYPCDDCCWKRNNGCFGEIEIDPKWAKDLYKKGACLHRILVFAMFVVKVFENFSSGTFTIGW